MQLNRVFRDWLNRRHITDEVIEQFGIYGDERIVIPVRDTHGNFLFNKYRRSPLEEDGPKYTYDKGGKISLYASDKIIGKKTILITEGEMDCLVAWSYNIPAVSSTGGALSWQSEWNTYLSDKHIIICFDNDRAGAEGIVKVLKVLPHASVLLLPDKPGVKDISDYVMHGGDLNELIKTARQFDGLSAVYADKSERQSTWRSTYFHDAYIKEHNHPPKKMLRMDHGYIDSIKEIPIDDFIEFKRRKACCLWHSEKTPSMHYYHKTNSLYCFGCGKYADIIDVVCKLYGWSFTEAVRFLKEKYNIKSRAL